MGNEGSKTGQGGASTATQPEALLTRYFIFESQDGTTWTRLGAQDARGSADALRKFFKDPLTDRDGIYVAVSENAFKPQRVNARVKTSISPYNFGDEVEAEEGTGEPLSRDGDDES